MIRIGLALVAIIAVCNLAMAVKLHDEKLNHAASLHYILGTTLIGALYALTT